MKNKAFIVIGLGFGDEGKGLATDYLCSRLTAPLVVRFNGGQQAGHTVVLKNGYAHVFSNLGAGTLKNCPTYWSSYCTFSPKYFLEEIQSLPIRPKIYLDKNCAVTTHYDVLYNRAIEITRAKQRYGSCGLGFGATVNRHFNDNLKLIVQDLENPSYCLKKLHEIRKYYRSKFDKATRFKFKDFDHDSEDAIFLNCVYNLDECKLKGTVQITDEKSLFSSKKWKNYVFEGAQGVLLDVTYGSFPHVTKSNTTSRNALEMIRRNFNAPHIDVQIFYVTRAYQTRHGKGPFNESVDVFDLINNEFETNKRNQYQGKFRKNLLDIDMLNYSINCDNQFSGNLKKNLIITCLDQLKDEVIPVYKSNGIIVISPLKIPDYLECRFYNKKFSYSSCSDFL